MELIQAQREHIPAMIELENRCFPEEPWADEVFERTWQTASLLMEDGVLIGYLFFSTVLDEGSIDNIAVAPDQRRKGLADLMMRDAIEKAEKAGLRTITLEVRVSNAPAIALYEKYGFSEVGRRKNYYNNPREDAILMTMVL